EKAVRISPRFQRDGRRCTRIISVNDTHWEAELCHCVPVKYSCILAYITVTVKPGRGDTMELKDLRICNSVAAAGSISRAAAELNFVQSYITTRMKALETELGTELLLRTSRGTLLTPDGEKLQKHADGILARVD